MIPTAARLGLFVLTFVAAISPTRRLAPPRVTIDTGTLEGEVDSTTGISVFRGIPYAAPPVGALRWKPPRAAARWSGVRPARQLGHNCMQGQPYSDIDPYAAGVSEDCLYLNVWTSSLGSAAPPKPVLVWIHGGGFFAGFGGEERHDGAHLAQKGAVVVTLNYRLGPFGFLAHPALAAESPHHASGNYGSLDQIAALQWVRRNIARFGGDPNRVTIFGESAGGMSVGALIASPLAKGLFARAILESGTGIGVGVSRRADLERTSQQLADSLGASGSDAAAAKRLRAVSPETVLAVAGRLGQPGAPRFWPVVDGWVFPQPVDSAIQSGKANLVPVIAGSNRDEGDEWMGAPTRTFARLMAARGVPVYLYIFSRVGDDSLNQRRGAYHSAEITFVFGRPHPLLPNAGTTAYDSTLAEAMSDYWVEFATRGDPNGAGGGKWPPWPRYSPATDALLEFGPEIRPRTMMKRAVYDSLDAIARSKGALRP